MNDLRADFNNRTMINMLHSNRLMKERQQWREVDNLTPSQEQINLSIGAIKQTFPHLCIQDIIKSLYKTFILKYQRQERGRFLARPTVIEIVDSLQSSQSIKNGKTGTKGTNAHFQDGASAHLKYNQHVKIKGDSSQREEQKRQRTFSLVDFGQESLDNLRRIIEWTPSVNKQHRMIVNKIAPKFNNTDEEVKYFEKRLAAKAFCERKYPKETQHQPSLYSVKSSSSLYHRWRKQLRQFNDHQPDFVSIQGYGAPRKLYDQDKERRETEVPNQRLADGGDQIKDKRRYKTVSSALISQSYRRLQLFLIQNCGRKIRTVTGPQMRALYAILLNAETLFKEQEYKTLQRIMKLTFDLGSVSIYEQSARQLYIRSQKCLRERVESIKRQSQNNEQFLAEHRNRKIKRENQYVKKKEGNLQQENERTLCVTARIRGVSGKNQLGLQKQK